MFDLISFFQQLFDWQSWAFCCVTSILDEMPEMKINGQATTTTCLILNDEMAKGYTKFKLLR